MITIRVTQTWIFDTNYVEVNQKLTNINLKTCDYDIFKINYIVLRKKIKGEIIIC